MPATTDQFIVYFNVFFDGAQASQDVMDDLLDISIDNSLHLPDMCTLRFHDLDFNWIDQTTFNPGTAVEVRGGYEQSSPTSLFIGEIASLELDLSAIGTPTILVRCYDQSHRLHRDRQSRSFVQVKDSDIASKIAGEMGFKAVIDETDQVHDWLLQNNQTNWEFLSHRAARNGYRIFVTKQNEMHFVKANKEPSSTVELKWGENLMSFRPRISTSRQVDSVTVRGWDPSQKQAIVGSASTPTTLPEIGDGTSILDGAKSKFGASKMVLVSHPVFTQAEADTLAQSVIDEIGGNYLQAEGLCLGTPELMPGVAVKIANIGTRFSGQYIVTSTAHLYSPSEGYTTTFSIGGKKPNTLLATISSGGGGGGGGTGGGGGGSGGGGGTGGNVGAGAGSDDGTSLGNTVAVGIVTDITDPDMLGRVKVKYPSLNDTDASYWARLVAPMAGPKRGFYYIPEVNDEVLVAFEHGDVTKPYVLGALWNGSDKPYEGSTPTIVGGQVMRRTIRSRIGHTIVLDDTDGTGRILFYTNGRNLVEMNDKTQDIGLKTTNGHYIWMDDAGKKISIVTTNGHQMVFDDGGNTITISDKPGNTITIDSGQNNISMTCLNNFSVSATGSVSITGDQGVTISTPMQFSASGDLGVTVESSTGNTAISGLLVNINS